MKQDKIILIYHKQMDRYDGNAAYVRKLIESLRVNYEVVLPSELFYRAKIRISKKWFIRTLQVNVFMILYFLKHKVRSDPNVKYVVMEDRYSLFAALYFLGSRAKLVSRVSDWGIEYVQSFPFHMKITKSIFYDFELVYELFVTKFSDAIIVPSEYLLGLLSKKNNFPVLVYPYSLNVPPQEECSLNLKIKRNMDFIVNCVFIGNYEYAPNREGAQFIIDSLSTEIYREDVNIKFIIAGPGAKERLNIINRENIEILGPVNNLDELYNRCVIGLNPTETVGGTSIKTIEYLIHGLFVISTPQSSKGVIETPRLLKTDRDHFKDEILKLARVIRSGENINDPREIERIRNYYSFSSNKEKLLNFFGNL
ncbi:MAG: glycosyltransferase [Conexivisphaerales archaeon]